MSEIIHYLYSCAWPTSLNKMISSSIHFSQMTGFHIFLIAKLLYICINSLPIYQLIENYFHFLAIVNCAAINMGVQLCFDILISFPLDLYPQE